MLIDPIYKDFYKQQTGHLILDNGAAEGELVGDPGVLVDMENEIHTDEITAPDVLGEMKETIDLLHRFHKFAATRTDAKTLVVLQCKTWVEFDYIFKEAEQYGQSVALPKIMCESLGPYARMEAADLIRTRNETIPIHCFGCTDWLREAYWLARQGIVRGIDSAAPIVSAFYGRSCWEKCIRRPSWYFNATPKKYAVGRVKGNMYEFGSWCSTPSTSEMRGVWPEQ